jgi:hypothetical protein
MWRMRDMLARTSGGRVKYTRERAIGSMGPSALKLRCAEAGFIFYKVDGDDDVGVDGYIEITDDERVATGRVIRVQIKTGESFRNSDGSYTFRADRAHFELWARGPLPTVGIVYDQSQDWMVWIDITRRLHEDPVFLDRNERALRIARENVLTADTLRSAFRDAMGVHFVNRHDTPEYAELLCAETGQDQVRGLELLISSPKLRNSRVACQVLTSRLFRLDPEPLRFATQLIACYYPHGGAAPSNDLWWFARRITADWTHHEFAHLFDCMDEDGIHGGFGWAIMVLLHSIFDPEEALLEIAFDESGPRMRRHHAMLCLGDYFGGGRTIMDLWNNIVDLLKADLGEAANWAVRGTHDRILDEDPDLLPNHDDGCPICGTSGERG